MSGLATLSLAGQDDLYSLLVERMRPMLLRALESAGPGQRLRITTLPQPVMDGVCRLLHGDDRWVARVLAAAPDDYPWRATATKLIELRNALEKPLLVFIPPGLRTAAEDSLDIATFTELSLAALAQDLVAALLQRFPEALRTEVVGVLGHLREQRHIRNLDEEVEYLLAVLKNGATPEAAGGALYVFGLLPDFHLFTRGNVLFWLSRNLKACELLAEGQPLQTAILRLPIKPNTIHARLFGFLRVRRRGDVRGWAREIAAEAEYRPLAIDQWEFVDTSTTEDLRLVIDPLALPRQTEDSVVGAAQLPVLNLDGRDPLKVAFRSIPLPSQVTAWKSWRVQIMSLRDGAPTVAWESNSYPKPQRQARVSRAIKAQDLQALEEGTYFLKVDAYDPDGALLTKPRRVDEEDPNSRGENESEWFLVVRGTDVNVVPEEPRSIFCSSLLDAWMRVATKSLGGKKRELVPERAAVHGEWDEPMGAPPKGDVYFELKSEGFTGFSVVVPSTLRRIEREILEHADKLGVYALSFIDVRTVSDVEVRLKEPVMLGSGPDVEGFLAARRAVFRAIYQHHFKGEGVPKEDTAHRAGLVETVDLAPVTEHIERYAAAYVALADAARTSPRTEELASRVRALAHLDVVELRWRQSAGDPGRAMTIAPTHPLRMLWHLRHTEACDHAERAWEDGTRKVPNWRDFMDQLREGLLPMNLPMVLFDHRGRGYVEHTPLTHFWPLYLPDSVEGDTPLDAVATRDRVVQHLGVHDRAVAVTTVDPRDVAARLYEYLSQHPYVEQLRVNVFNPGDGRLIADVLRRLEHLRLYDRVTNRARPNPPSLRYSVQLFAAAESVDATGDGLESLLDPDRQVGEDDEFTLSTSNHLLPKLVFARSPVTDFLQAPERFPAHVSILLEQFVVHSRVGRTERISRGSYVGGLVQEPETQVELQSGSHFGWVKGLRPLARRGAAPQEALLNAAVAVTQQLQASFATGQPVQDDVAPVVALELDPTAQSLLKQVHEVSDWVLTLDRNLGLDYFDSPASSREAGYLLDFAPEYLQEDRQRILLTTRSHVELENIVRPVMNRYGLAMETGDEILVLETLRSLSGRLALRLEASRNQAAEVVGLLLARWLLERVGLLEQRLVIPLDAHRNWFNASEDEASQHRADLLLVGFTEPNTLRMDIVEVKLREELSGSARSDLYSQMRRQTENTVERLRELFAQDLYPQPRADELLRAKELASALGFYVRRARRYELLTESEAARAFRVIDNLDNGYQLDIRSLGVVFEHKGRGLHVDEEEPGFPVHRFGGDKARQLLAHAAGRLSERNARISERTGTPYRPPSSLPERTALAAQLEDRELKTLRSALSVRDVPAQPYADRMVDGRPLTAREPDVLPYAAASTPSTPRFEGPEEGVSAPELPLATAERAADRTIPEPPAVATAAASRAPAQPASVPMEQPQSVVPADGLIVDVLLGATEMTPQYGVLGKAGSQKVAIDLNGCNTISLFGVQGFGKSYTLGVIAEMASATDPGINVLPSPLATVIFHYHKSDAYAPEYASAVAPNQKQSEVERLRAEYGANPVGLRDVVLLAPEAKVEQRRREFSGITVEPLKFASSELGADSWKFLLGAYGNDALYIRQLVAIMRRHRGDLTIGTLRQEIAAAGLPPATQRLADDRLNLAEPYIDDAHRLGELLRPGRTVIVDLRDEWIEKDEALGLFVVMLRIFAAAKFGGREFNKLVVFDEAHKYITESDLIGQVVETIREMRHQATTVVIASQDPLSVPRAVIELTSILILHRMTSPQWLKHLKSALAPLDGIEEGHLAALGPGEALVWAQRSTDRRFTLRPQKVHVRPRFTQHGGGTKTAVAGVTIR
jgi:DNA phosphorothioation-dependent restriction protein DptH